MDLSQLSPADEIETLTLEIVKLMQKVEENTHTKAQEPLEFKLTKPKQNFNFDKQLIIPKKWLMGVTILQVYNTVYKMTERNKIFAQFYLEIMSKNL